jgi:sugar phosphate isomerase/epimerase
MNRRAPNHNLRPSGYQDATRLKRRAFLKAAAALVTAPWTVAQSPAPRFSLAHLTVLGCAPPEVARIAARAGYDFASYRIITMGLSNEPNYDLARNPSMLRETKAALAESHVEVHDIELARVAEGVDVKSYAPAFETGAELGARRVISSIWTPDETYAQDFLGKLCDLAQKSGLSVSLEFVTWTNLPNLQAALRMLRAVNRPNLGLLIDVLHFNRSRVKLAELDAVPPERFHFAHISDAPKEIPSSTDGLIRTAREARLDPGEGGIDVASIVNRMPLVPYSLEIPNLKRVKEVGYAEHARLCLIHSKAYFAAHPHS